jgi:hypothetical protein
MPNAIKSEGVMAILEKESKISAEELAQRVAILRRFKILLTQQRDRFRSYLEVLDKQENVIESGSAEDLLTYVEMEEKIVADIFSIQKVIDPLEDMYRSVLSGFGPGKTPSIDALESEGTDEVPGSKAALEDLKNEAVLRSTKNKELLSKRMVELRSEIKALRENPYLVNSRRSSFGDGNTASMIDISG